MAITPNSIENVNIILKFTNVLAFEFGMNFGWFKLHYLDILLIGNDCIYFFLFLVYVIIEN